MTTQLQRAASDTDGTLKGFGMSVTVASFKERSGCTVFRDTSPENVDARAPRVWKELPPTASIGGAQKGEFFSDVVTGASVSRIAAYQRYWAGSGTSSKSPEGNVVESHDYIPSHRAPGYVPMTSAEMATGTLVAGAALALGSVLLRMFRGQRS